MITEKTIDAYLDAQGISRGPWYISGTAWIVGKDIPIIKLFDSEINPDTHVLKASLEMLKALMEESLFDDDIMMLTSDQQRRINIIESALPGRRWEDIKKELERMEVGEDAKEA